jgi:hypothetical protein
MDERIVPVRNYDVEDLGEAVKNALDMVSLDLPPTAVRLLKQRLIAKAIPSLGDEDRASIEDELDSAEEDDRNAEALQAEIDRVRAQKPAATLPPLGAPLAPASPQDGAG